MHFLWSNQSRYRGVLLYLTALVLLLAGSKATWAASCSSGGGQAYTLTFPGSVAVPRDAPVGTLLTPWTATVGSSNLFYCYNDGLVVGVAFAPDNLSASGQSYTSGGVTYKLFNTSVPGVGLAVAVKVAANGCGFGPGWLDLGTPGTYPGWKSPPPAGYTGGSCSAGGSLWNGGEATAALVTTGPVQAGQIASTIVASALPYQSGPSMITNLPAATWSISPVDVTVLSCVTPDVMVPMGTHSASELTGLNTFTSAASFNVSLNSCPAGMNTVQYEIQPSTAVIDRSQSVVALDSSSTATGVGVQLLDGTGAVFPLSTRVTFSGYNQSTGGSYTIPFQARCYQTADTVGPGRANTSMALVMTYQ